MASRYVPYAAAPGRFLVQVVSDIFVLLWTTLWVLVGLAVHTAIAKFGDFGHQVENGANGIGHNLDAAGQGADRIPLIGDAISKPLTSAGDAARHLAGAGHNLHTTATWLAVVLALAVAGPPILAVGTPWLIRRVRFLRHKRLVLALAASPAGEQLLALRALASRPLRRLVAVDVDPAGAWRREDAAAIRGLATLEMHAAGLKARYRR